MTPKCLADKELGEVFIYQQVFHNREKEPGKPIFPKAFGPDGPDGRAFCVEHAPDTGSMRD